MIEPVHVITDRHPHRGTEHLGIVHSSVQFSPDDIVRMRGIPVTGPLRTLRDLAGRVHFDRLDLVCERMLAKRLLRIDELHALVAGLPRRGGAKGTSALRRLVLERDLDHRPAESNLERRFERILAEAGELPFERQVDLGDDDGWIGRVDFVDRGACLVVEVQSAIFHSSRIDRCRDQVRLDRLRLAGWTVIEINELDIWYHPSRVIAMVRAARRSLSKAGSPTTAGAPR